MTLRSGPTISNRPRESANARALQSIPLPHATASRPRQEPARRIRDSGRVPGRSLGFHRQSGGHRHRPCPGRRRCAEVCRHACPGRCSPRTRPARPGRQSGHRGRYRPYGRGIPSSARTSITGIGRNLGAGFAQEDLMCRYGTSFRTEPEPALEDGPFHQVDVGDDRAARRRLQRCRSGSSPPSCGPGRQPCRNAAREPSSRRSHPPASVPVRRPRRRGYHDSRTCLRP